MYFQFIVFLISLDRHVGLVIQGRSRSMLARTCLSQVIACVVYLNKHYILIFEQSSYGTHASQFSLTLTWTHTIVKAKK